MANYTSIHTGSVIDNVTSNALLKTEASSIYLTQSNAASLYLTQQNANILYPRKDGTGATGNWNINSSTADALTHNLEVWLPGNDLLDHSKNNYTVTMAGTVTANNIQTVNGISAPCLYRATALSTTNKLSIIS